MDRKAAENNEFMQNLGVMKQRSKIEHLKLDILNQSNGLDDVAYSQSISAQSLSDTQPPVHEKQSSFGSELRNDLITFTNQIMEINGQQKVVPRTSISRLNNKNLVLCAFQSQVSDHISEKESNKTEQSMIFSPRNQQAISVLNSTLGSNHRFHKTKRNNASISILDNCTKS